MPERKKRKIHFRNGEVFPYESGSFIHENSKKLKEQQLKTFSNLDFGLEPKRTRRRKQSLF
jgi:hypothetical protein